MINVSDTFKQKLQDGERVWQEVEITFPDGTVKTVKNEIMGENCTFSDCAESSSFPIGCVVCKSMTLELDNTSDQWKNYNFYMAKVHAYLKMQTSVASPAIVEELLDENYDPVLDHNNDAIIVTKGATADVIETIDKGTYTVTTPEQYGEIIKLTALDDMYKSNTAYNTKLKLPQTLSILVRDACDTLDIPMGFTVMSHGAMPISEIPENMTFRQFFGYVAMIECANARLNQKGQLEFVKWSLDKEPTIELFDYISAPTISSDDIVITGIEVVKGDKSELYGKTGYVLKMENDLVSDEDLATVAAQIGDSIIGTRFRNLQGESAFNPLLEFGDVVYSHDRKRNKYITPLTDVSYTINGKTSVKTQAEDPIRGMSQFVSEGTKAIAAARRLVQQEKTAREKALEVLGEQLKDATGVYTTEEIQEDGSRIFYLHDKPTLAESKAIWKMTSEAWGVSTDGGQTWNGGMTVDGDTIVRILTAVGLNADWINTGAITVKDADKNIIFQVDMDTKTVVIDPDVLIIGNMTLSEKLENMDENIASAKNMTFQLSNDMQTITSDADGNIPVFPTVATTAKVMYGSSDITNDCSYTITKSDSVTGSWSDATHIYNVTGLSADNGWIDIRATYLSNLSVTKRFTISKQKKGEDGKDGEPGRTYIIESSCNVLKRGADKNVSPNFLKFNAYYRDGDSATRYAYKGRFVIEETTDGNTWKTIYTSSTDEDTVTHYLYTILTNSSSETISNSNGSTIGIPRDVTNVRCKLYASGGTTTLMDMQSVAVVIDVDNLTQEQIVKILSDDGKWNGLYYRNGKLYISFSSAMGGSLLLGGKNNSEGFLKILDKTNKAKALADYSGFTCFSNYSETNGVAEYDGIRFSETGIEPVSAKKNLPERPDNPTNPDGSVDIEYSDGSPWWSIDISKNSDGESIMSIYGAENITGAYGEFDSLNTDGGNQRAEAFSVKDVFYAKETITNTGEDVFYAKFEKELACRAGLRVYSLPTITSGWNCYIDQNNYKVSALSSSSKRYKILGASLPEEFIENLYNIEPIMARYKKGYLAKGDERVDAEFPMFIAEDVDKYFPLAVDHNTDGLPENWNERIMIPAMFAMIKSQKEQIDRQEKLINQLYEKLNIEKIEKEN